MRASQTINYFDQGILAYKGGEFDKAVEYFKMVMHAAPADWNAQFYMAMALAQNMQTKLAQSQFRTISELCPDAVMRQRAAHAAKSLHSLGN